MGRQEVVKKVFGRAQPDYKSSDLDITLKVHNENDIKKVRFLGIDTGLLDQEEFRLIFKDVYDRKKELLRVFVPSALEFMDIENFVILLKKIGVKAASAEEVGKKISQNRSRITVSVEEDASHASPAVHVLDNSPAMLALEHEPRGNHSTRILQERLPAGLATPDEPVVPSNWMEAQAQVPGLRKWVEAKREAGLTMGKGGPGRRDETKILEALSGHLRNKETGWGLWARSASGLPRSIIKKCDPSLYGEIYALGNPMFPSDILIPNGKPTGRPQGALDSEKRAFAPRPNQKSRELRVPVPTPDEAREARRIAKRAERAGRRQI